MIKLEEMGTILMHIALQYTHPDFESMYSDWSTVHDIGEKLVKMSDQPQLNENQQIVLEWLKKNYFDSYFKAVISNLFFFIRHDDIDGFPNETSHKMVEAYGQLSNKEFAKVLEVFSRWVQEQEAE